MLKVDQPGTDRRQRLAGHPLVLVEELADEAGRVARLLQPHVEGALGVAVGVEGRPAAEHRRALVGGVGAHAGLVGVLPGEEARPRDAAQRVGDEGVRIAGARPAHPLHRPHRLDEVHREVVEHDDHDVGALRPGSRRAAAHRPTSAAAAAAPRRRRSVVGAGRERRRRTRTPCSASRPSAATHRLVRRSVAPCPPYRRPWSTSSAHTGVTSSGRGRLVACHADGNVYQMTRLQRRATVLRPAGRGPRRGAGRSRSR